MGKRIRAQLSYANVTATVALVLALGGGAAWAVDKIGSRDIRPNAVRAKHIKQNAVRAKQLAANSVRADEIAAGAVGLDEIAPSSITGAAIAPSSITGAKIVPGSISGASITPNSLGGAHINEASLAGVDAATLDGIGPAGFPRAVQRTAQNVSAASLAAHTCTTQTLGVSQAELGDLVVILPDEDMPAGLINQGGVTFPIDDFVNVQHRICNVTAGTISWGLGDWTVKLLVLR